MTIKRIQPNHKYWIRNPMNGELVVVITVGTAYYGNKECKLNEAWARHPIGGKVKFTTSDVVIEF